ncbi:MAG: lipid-A-disaccharide synthase [Bacteroidaceae bacterium]|nr:lipid-A-disaccharide synthase [Bacteroidaceae bacterium]
MRYYLVAGEASGDLHASHLMAALRDTDPEAQFRFIGGDKMLAVGGDMVRHYRDLAYMGLIPVLLHLPTILRAMRAVRADVLAWRPDALILIDYPGFNLQLANYIHSHTSIPTFYYIAPKIWAWKERRIKNIRRDIDHLLSILPFEKEFFEGKHHYPITYVGNPTMDEVSAYLNASPPDKETFCDAHGIDPSKPIIALLAGSRKQEIRDNLPLMLDAAAPFADDYSIVLAAAPSIPDATYAKYEVKTVRDATYPLLHHATAALVTSGTATLETALFRVPQVVCYKIPRFWEWCRPFVLKIPFISLVNLIAGKEVVPELLADISAESIRRHLSAILPKGEARQAQLEGYETVARKLGEPGAPRRAADYIFYKSRA